MKLRQLKFLIHALVATALLTGIVNVEFGFASNVVIVESKTVPIATSDIPIRVRLINDVPLEFITVPLTVRSVSGGAFINSIRLSYADRLQPDILTVVSQLRRYQNREFVGGGVCDSDSTYATSDDASSSLPVFTSPEGVLFQRVGCGAGCGDELMPGFDLDGSLTLSVGTTLLPGTFEIDTTCVSPGLQLQFFGQGADHPVSFTRGTITVVDFLLDTLHVDPLGDDVSGDGSIGAPFQTIQKAIDEISASVADAGVVMVHPGTYNGPIQYPTGFGLSLVSSGGAAQTHLIGNNTGSVVVLASGSPDIHQVLDGFTIRDNTSIVPQQAGGATVSSATWGSIRNCIVAGNRSTTAAAGIEFRGDRGVIANNWIVDNEHLAFASAVAGVFLSEVSEVEFVNNTVAGNETISEFGTAGVQIGSLIAAVGKNEGEDLTGSRFSVPSAQVAAAAILRFDNNIIAGNGPAAGYSNGSEAPAIAFLNCLYSGNGQANATNGAPFDISTLITDAPQFIDTLNGDYHLSCNSPAVDQGSVVSVPADIVRDIDGQSRFGPDARPVDIGADEVFAPAPLNFSTSVLSAACQLLEAEFSATEDVGITSYTWFFGDGDSTTGNPVTHEYTVTGDYTVTVRVMTVCGLDSLTVTNLISVSGPVTADFVADETTGCDSVDVEFLATASAIVDSFIWDFGDGTPRVTTIANSEQGTARHLFRSAGAFDVTVFAANDCGVDTVVQENLIVVHKAPNVFINSSHDTTTGTICNPYTVEFRHTTTESLTSYLWEFGDNTSSTDANPVHTYTEGGRTYSIRLTATGQCGSDVVLVGNYITVQKRPTAELTADVTDICAGAEPVTLSAAIDGVVTNSTWHFDDGITAPGPVAQHTYATTGTYVPRLIMSHQCGIDTILLADTISVGLPPVAAISASGAVGYEPFDVTFSDLSQNVPSAWSWDFGDSETSTQQNPVHTYTNSGVYSVSLDISNPCGTDAAALAEPITVGGFDLSVDSAGVSGDTIRYAVDVDSNILVYDNLVQLSARTTATPRRGSVQFAFGTSAATPPFATTMHAIPTMDLAKGDYTIEVSAMDPSRVTKRDSISWSHAGMQFVLPPSDTIQMDSSIVFTGSSRTVSIRNNAPLLSGMRLVVQSPSITGSSVFSVQGVGQNLQPQQELRWDILFTPRVKGRFGANLRVRSDDPVAPDFLIPITGLGIGEQSPPHLVSASEGDVRIDEPIVFEFSEAMITDTSASIMSVRSGSGAELPGRRRWTSNRNLQFEATDFLSPDDTLSVVIRAVITDTNGNFLDGNDNGSEEGSPIDDLALTISTGPGVYPGDTDNDGVVNEGDILPLGRFYGLSGPMRPAAQPGFSLQPADPWDIRAATYADADGSGDIDSLDICAIAEFFEQEATLPKATVDSWLEQAKSWSGNVVTALRNALTSCPNSGPGQPALHRFLDELGGGAPVPSSFALAQNYPNPFNPSTLIQYEVGEPVEVRLEIFDITGARVILLAEGHREAGVYRVVWDGQDSRGRGVSSGVYFYRLQAGKHTQARKMILLK